MLFAFDPNQARAIGLNTTVLHLTLLTLLAATAVAALQTVGACLVVAMLVTPGATAYQLTDRFGRMIGLATLMGVVTSFVGAYASYFLDGSTGGCIVVLQTLLFLAALLFAPKHGIVASRLRARATTAELTEQSRTLCAACAGGRMNFARLLEPLQYGFMVEAMLIAALIGAVCAVLSCYLVLKGWSLMGDAVSHAVLPGIVLAYMVGLPLAVGAFCAGLLCAGSTGWIKNHSRIKEDTIMGVVFTGLFALGLVMFTKVQTDIHLNHILFGSLLGIERSDMIQAIVSAGVTLAVILTLRKDLLLYLFDANQARAVGLNTTALHYVLLALLSATIVAALQAVGIILTVAMLVAPGCIAFLLSDRFDRMLWIASGSAIFSAVVGTYVSYFLNGATGACIVLTQSLVFVLAMIFAPKHGLLVRRTAINS